MSGRIRNPLAAELQGRRAGFIPRAIASTTDIVIAIGLVLAMIVGISVLWDLFFSDKIELTSPPQELTGALMWVGVVVYLTLGWTTTGRSIGKQMMGLRVVRRDGTPLGVWRALGRAALCATFYWVLLWALVSSRNEGIEDLVCRTAVVHDWIPADGMRSVTQPA